MTRGDKLCDVFGHVRPVKRIVDECSSAGGTHVGMPGMHMEPSKDLGTETVIIRHYYPVIFVVQFVDRVEPVTGRWFVEVGIMRVSSLHAIPEGFYAGVKV